MNSSGKTALVTGAALGVGRATALEFAALGHNVALVDFDETNLLSAKKEIEDMGCRTAAYVCDVSQEQRVREICAAVTETFGGVDILVNNAGLYRYFWGSFLNTDSNVWKRLIDVNILGTMYFTHSLLPGMLQKHYGRIINVGSVAGEYGLANGVPYSHDKGRHQRLYHGAGKRGDRAGHYRQLHCPGHDPLSEGCGRRLQRTADQRHQPFRTPEECAQLIAFLASDNAAYISGQNYKIDGCRRKL